MPFENLDKIDLWVCQINTGISPGSATVLACEPLAEHLKSSRRNRCAARRIAWPPARGCKKSEQPKPKMLGISGLRLCRLKAWFAFVGFILAQNHP
jgi:hypothetical protein